MERSRTRTNPKRGKLRVYHFVGPEYGLDDIRRRRLKIATIADLNAPFELLPSSTDQTARARFNVWRDRFSAISISSFGTRSDSCTAKQGQSAG